MFSSHHPPSSPSTSSLTPSHRRAQYKSAVSISPCRFTPNANANSSARMMQCSPSRPHATEAEVSDTQRSRMRNLANAVRNRKNQREETQRKRRMSCGSDEFGLGDDEEMAVDDEEVYDDELMRRIAITLNQRDHEARFQRTYRREVGSSYDLALMSDPERLEAEATRLDYEDEQLVLAELHALEAREELNAYAAEAATQDMADPELEAMFDDVLFEGLSYEELQLLGVAPRQGTSSGSGGMDMDIG